MFPIDSRGSPDGLLPLPYRIGFESQEGFILGALNGQQGWTSSLILLGQPVVSNLHPHSGQQHIRLVDTPGAPDHLVSRGSSPILQVGSNHPTVTHLSVSINNVTPGPDGGATHIFAGIATAMVSMTSFAVSFNPDGNIQVNDGGFVNTGQIWSPNTWMNLRVFHNPPDNQIAYWLNDELIYTNVNGILAGNRVSQIVISSDNRFQPGESGDFDDLHVLPVLPGDATIDGVVNLQDFNVLAAHFGATSGVTWLEADFTSDGRVNLDDFNILAGNFGESVGPHGPTPEDWAALASAVPEPSLALLAGVAASAATLRRRRR